MYSVSCSSCCHRHRLCVCNPLYCVDRRRNHPHPHAKRYLRAAGNAYACMQYVSCCVAYYPLLNLQNVIMISGDIPLPATVYTSSRNSLPEFVIIADSTNGLVD